VDDREWDAVSRAATVDAAGLEPSRPSRPRTGELATLAPNGIRPRILHIKGSGKYGGDCVLILELARSAREQNYDVDILATDRRFQELIREEGFGVVDLDVVRREIRPLWDLQGLLRLTRFLSGSGYSIVHTHTSKPGVVGALAARWAGVPGVMHTLHLLPFHEETGMLQTAAYTAVERLAARWCDRIVAVSEHQRAWALRQKIGDRDQVVAIPNGISDGRVRPTRPREQVRRELGVSDRFVLLSTGRLVDQKGLEYLIDAAAMVRGQMPAVAVVLAGDGPRRTDLERLVRARRLEDVVSFLGFRRDVANLLAAADLVVLPSLWEGLSISLLEAMAAGTAVVTTSIGANREVTNDGESAVLVPPKDPGSLAVAVLALAADAPRRERLAQRGREIQRERYGTSRMLEAYSQEYARLLETKCSVEARPRAAGALA
jgi:glycosyltransferase involved in cell wall biosynthesis